MKKCKKLKKINQDLALIDDHRVPLSNWNFVKPQIFLILNWLISKSFLKGFAKRTKISSGNSKLFGRFCLERRTLLLYGRRTKGHCV